MLDRARFAPFALALSVAPGVLAMSGLASMAACTSEQPSNLAKLADADKTTDQNQPETKTADSGAIGAATAEDGADTTSPDEDGSASTTWPVDADGIPLPPQDGAAPLLSPGAEDKRVQLRLALADDAHYRITTIGMLKLPLIEKPTGFAREEDVSVSDCKGEEAARTCLLTHTYRNYEAEPPAGSGLEADEKQVAGLTTSHRVDASGLRITDTAVIGEASPAHFKALAQVHRLYCVRLPSEPVGVGATWKDVCRLRQGGSIVTRELTWRLAKLEDTEEGVRAEIEYAGRVRRIDPKGKLINGEIMGALYFWVDAGEPHLMRERVGFTLDAGKGVTTGTDFRYQFSKVGSDGEELLRTDGKPFDMPPQALNDLRSVPSGTTRDGELQLDQK
ncbi:hypothetical protein DB30_05833 [Enhygromyxa salina]|uniref:Lipoprotein n=1 Tax=Enhygromyxa salina TaxID=215803 RepID=A0A0C1ZVQ2_9BACT|nr:hypothetical protein [Enhygromyxa salina]KIG15133.1 hypothetical protein DB30_05833 [Enhygromyxa salina]